MSSPFTKNATLKFNLSSKEMEIDDYGNERAKTEPLIVTAFLKFSGRSSGASITRSRESDSSAITGAGQLSENWVGFLIEPLLLPVNIKPGMIAEAEITTGLQRSSSGGVEPLIEKGEFTLGVSPMNSHLILSAIDNITPIAGTFTRTV